MNISKKTMKFLSVNVIKGANVQFFTSVNISNVKLMYKRGGEQRQFESLLVELVQRRTSDRQDFIDFLNEITIFNVCYWLH